jgi:hypothetical protein
MMKNLKSLITLRGDEKDVVLSDHLDFGEVIN